MVNFLNNHAPKILNAVQLAIVFFIAYLGYAEVEYLEQEHVHEQQIKDHDAWEIEWDRTHK